MSPASGAPEITAKHIDGHLAGADGKSIFWQAYLPETDPKAVLVIAHGAGEHGSRYRYVFERLVPAGYAIYAIDHRGHGRSEGTGAQIDRMAHVLSDLDQLVDLARREHPEVKQFLLGHSMGGCISISYALAHQEKLDGLVLSSPLAALEAAPLPLRLIAQALSFAAPGLPLIGVESDGVSRDPGEVADYNADPLVHHGKLPARTVQELALRIGRFEAEAPTLTLPLLVMIGTADTLCPPAGGTMIHDRAASTDKTLKSYDGYFHELFNEPAGDRDVALDDLAAWLDQHA
ncbi:MAG: acylglycerol lipase [Solirubrobacteraceae bacterium]|jgi:lysophospholipase|nr:acylglycerol lipase [Solirubrobacteraceae bacterium]